MRRRVFPIGPRRSAVATGDARGQAIAGSNAATIVAASAATRAAISKAAARSAATFRPAADGRPGARVDRANAERLKRGRHPVEARLDLHGLTQAEAHRALPRFLRAARAGGKRCVLVITGRGSGRELGAVC